MPDELRRHAASIVGESAARLGTPADAIDGIVPRLVVEPSTDAEAGAVVAWASHNKLSVLPRGSGSKLQWGPTPQSIDVLISTTRMNAVVAHRHGDLTATIQSGARLIDVNRTLAGRGQWLPLDPLFFSQATIGGLVATNDSGPRRHRYGAPRDLIIGIEFARADGRLARGGGIVVKNVAGYDLPRLLSGSFGSLGVIVTATFKLYPLTAASQTLVVELATPADLGRLASQLSASHLTPTALEFATGPLRLIVRFESIEASVAHQMAAAEQMVRDAGWAAVALSGETESQLWDSHRHALEAPEGCLLKVSVLPTELPATLQLIESLGGGDSCRAAGRAGLGVFYVRIAGDIDRQERVVTGLRASIPAGRGGVQLAAATPELKSRLDVWGSVGDALRLMAAVKQQFDPSGVFSPGRAPGNL